MLPIQRYHAEGYPPGALFPGFGPRALAHALGVHDASWEKLAGKRQGMQELHLGRLQAQGLHQMPPIRHRFSSRIDPEEVEVDAFDHAVPRPSFLPPHHSEERYESASERTVSVPGSPRDPSIDIPVPEDFFEEASPVISTPAASPVTPTPAASPIHTPATPLNPAPAGPKPVNPVIKKSSVQVLT